MAHARSIALAALALLAGSLVLLAGTVAPPAQAARGLTEGFSSDSALVSGSAAADQVWIPRAVSEGAGMVRVNVNWSQVAPAQPATGFVATDPGSSGYRWRAVDEVVRQLTSHGLQVLFNVWGAPTWAQGPNRPASAPPLSWEPSDSELGAFAQALARRYDGSFPDPENPGRTLPRVRDFQAWNEPNLSQYLTPQWQRTTHGWQPASPGIYRGMLNAFYRGVKSVSRRDFVVSAGTAPYGDPPGGDRMAPVAFDRSLFCLSGRTRLKPTACPDPPHLDALAHHPYSVGGPLWHAQLPDDAAVADMYKLARVLHAAQRAHHVVPDRGTQLWVTEISWDSKPPDPAGVPIERQARWYEQAMYVLWSQGVDTVLLLQIVDSAPVPSYAASYQAGLYYLNGKPKPAALAFRFPFVTHRVSADTVGVWCRAPAAGVLRIRRREHGRWRVVRKLRVRKHEVVVTTIPSKGRSTFDATIAGQRSLSWSQGG